MGKQTKKARRFGQQGHLDKALKRRKAKPPKPPPRSEPAATHAAAEPAATTEYDRSIEELDVDEFLDGNFLGEAQGEEAEEAEEEEEEEEEEEAGNEDDVDGLHDEVTKHKAELEELKKADPDFFKYLQQNDGNLLSFGEDDDKAGQQGSPAAAETEEEREDDEEEEDEDEDAAEDGDSGSGSSTAHTELTSAALKAIGQSAFQDFSLKGLRKVVHAFRDACRIGSAQQSNAKGRTPFVINSR